jgi:hypothetical protein
MGSLRRPKAETGTVAPKLEGGTSDDTGHACFSTVPTNPKEETSAKKRVGRRRGKLRSGTLSWRCSGTVEQLVTGAGALQFLT